MPKISIIIPVYNTEKYLDRCLSSVLRSSLKDIEVLIINDGSPDGELCNKYAESDTRVRVIHRSHQGVASSRNEGLRLASAPYIGFVDSDDMVHPQMFEVLHKLMLQHNADIVSCSVLEFADDDTKSYEHLSMRESDSQNVITMTGIDALKKFLISSPITSSAIWDKLYRKDIFNDLQFPDRKVSSDAAVAYKLYHKSNLVVHINTKYYYYAIRANSITNSEFSSANMGKLSTADEVLDFINANYPELIYYAKSFNIVTAMRLAAYFNKQTIDLYPKEYGKIKQILLSRENSRNPLLSHRHRLMLFLFKYYRSGFMALWKRRLKPAS